MASGPQVNGRAFLGLIHHIKTRFGKPMLDEIVADSGPLVREAFSSPIHVLTWYRYEALAAFLEGAERKVGHGDRAYCRTLGVATGKRDLGTILRVYVALASAERLIRSCASIWPSYYRNAGRMEATAWQPDRTVVRIYDFPGMAPAHCRLMEGWMQSTMETIGFRLNPGAGETECPSRGGQYHEFQCTWRDAKHRDSSPSPGLSRKASSFPPRES
jgi:hypothetical protein